MLQMTTKGAVVICSLFCLTNQNSKPEALCLSLNILIIALYRFQRQCWDKEKNEIRASVVTLGRGKVVFR